MIGTNHAEICGNGARWVKTHDSSQYGKTVAIEFYCPVHSENFWLAVPPVSNFERIKEFVRVFDASHDAKLWLKLIDEERDELNKAIERHDLIEAFDGICDLLYVTYGCGLSLNLPVDLGYAEVHRSNMTKLGEDGKPIKREDGKIMKGPNYDPPHLEQFI